MIEKNWRENKVLGVNNMIGEKRFKREKLI